MPKYTGVTSSTAENLILDSGAFFKDYDVSTDTFETAVTAGKLIGATRGGGEFTALPQIKEVEVDGVPGAVKGLERLTRWDVNLKANVLELSKEVIKMALLAVTDDTTTEIDYDIIEGKTEIEVADYIDNITWVGRLAGSEKPVIIQVFNTFNQDGFGLTMQDENEGVAALNFKAHFIDATTKPFKIYYPKLA